MAEPEILKQEFAIRNLPTQSVTLYPARAQVVRDIKDVSLGVSKAQEEEPYKSDFN